MPDKQAVNRRILADKQQNNSAGIARKPQYLSSETSQKQSITMLINRL
jgi:hypothetical protein